MEVFIHIATENRIYMCSRLGCQNSIRLRIIALVAERKINVLIAAYRSLSVETVKVLVSFKKVKDDGFNF